LGDDVEGEGNQTSFRRAGLAHMLQGVLQQFVADALPLSARCNEQLAQDPESTANPTQGKPDDFAIIFG
jgi:hypothetical protein